MLHQHQKRSVHEQNLKKHSEVVAEHQRAYLAAGCFWGVEEAFRTTPGVVHTAVGYMGGHTERPTYKDVCTGTTGHAETVEIVFDPEKISYEKILELFWKIHNPTQINRQGPDVGEQYRSVIFYTSPEQQRVAEESKKLEQQNGGYHEPIATSVESAGTFWLAEEYHQQYTLKNGGAVCRV